MWMTGRNSHEKTCGPFLIKDLLPIQDRRLLCQSKIQSENEGKAYTSPTDVVKEGDCVVMSDILTEKANEVQMTAGSCPTNEKFFSQIAEISDSSTNGRMNSQKDCTDDHFLASSGEYLDFVLDDDLCSSCRIDYMSDSTINEDILGDVDLSDESLSHNSFLEQTVLEHMDRKLL